jgi:hypothetical protein
MAEKKKTSKQNKNERKKPQFIIEKSGQVKAILQ